MEFTCAEDVSVKEQILLDLPKQDKLFYLSGFSKDIIDLSFILIATLTLLNNNPIKPAK